MRTDFLQQLQQQHDDRHPFCLATVIKVDGSASARMGSKAIFDSTGKNVSGWVGGGCAERFVGEQSVEALHERRPRTVLADLDDEVFGLGVACGGTMEIFIEPIFPEETLRLLQTKSLTAEATRIAKILGMKLEWEKSTDLATDLRTENIEDLMMCFAQNLAQRRGRPLLPLREDLDLPVRFTAMDSLQFSSISILGKGRIVETITQFSSLLGWKNTVIAPGLNAQDYPEHVRCQCLLESYDEIQFQQGSAVLIASHHAKDPSFVKMALDAGANYVGMIGSHKRANEVFDQLHLPSESSLPLFVPAGLDLDARTPEEIALSIVAELIQLQTRNLIP